MCDDEARIDAIEQGQAAMQQNLATISAQLQQLLAGLTPQPPTAQISVVQPAVQPVTQPPVQQTQRRRLETSSLEKLHADCTLLDFRSWRNRWQDFCRLNQLASYPLEEQTAALRLSLDTSMQQVVEITLDIAPTDELTPDEILDAIAAHIRLKRNVALDRVAFEECCQSPNETSDEFLIRLKRLAGSAELCALCADQRMATRVIAGVREGE